MSTKIPISFYSFEKTGDEVSRTEVELTDVEAPIGVLKGAAHVRFDGNEFGYVDYYVDVDNDQIAVQVNID